MRQAPDFRRELLFEISIDGETFLARGMLLRGGAGRVDIGHGRVGAVLNIMGQLTILRFVAGVVFDVIRSARI